MSNISNTEEFQKRKQLLVNRSLGRQYMESYLRELNSLFRCSITTNNLLTLEDSLLLIENIKAAAQSFEENSLYKTQTAFEDKEKLRSIFKRLYHIYQGEIYATMGYSQYCGIVRIPSLLDFNIDFSFSDEHSGLITLYAAETFDFALLDFSEDCGVYDIEVEINGRLWNKETIGL